MIRDLSQKEIRFCEEYLVDLNATQAAIRAGYSKKTATVIGSQNLRKLKVKRYIETRAKKIQEKLEVTQEMIMNELATIGFSRITNYLSVTEREVRRKIRGKMKTTTVSVLSIFPTDKIKEEHIPAIASIKQAKEGIELKVHDKVKALELMGKHRGMFKDPESPIQLNVTIE